MGIGVGGGVSLEWKEVVSRYVCVGRREDKWGVGVCVCVDKWGGGWGVECVCGSNGVLGGGGG